MQRLMSRIMDGALAGLTATMPMTTAMSRLHKLLPPSERYPLPPREISASLPDPGLRPVSAALGYHFLYGAIAGSLLAVARPNASLPTGAAFGLAVWAASYMGWIPAARILKPANNHPARRNTLMLAAHLVWGVTLAKGLQELQDARPAFSAQSAIGRRRRRPSRPRL